MSKKLLSELPTRINREYKLATDAAHTAIEHAIKAGELLIQAKQAVKHGDWLPWLKKHCTISETHARNYMRLAKLPEAKRQRVADMPLRQAIEAMAEPKELQFHPLCEIWPMVSDELLNGIAASIKESGLLHPITLYEGKILDGKLRYLACKIAGVEPIYEELPEGTNPAAFSWSMNGQRQSFSSPTQRYLVKKSCEDGSINWRLHSHVES